MCGVIAMVIMLTSLLLTSMAVRAGREIGTMEQLMVTAAQARRAHSGQGPIPFAIIAFFDMVLVTVFGVLVFNIPSGVRSCCSRLSTAIYLLSILGIRARDLHRCEDPAAGAHARPCLFYMPAVLLSGFMFPSRTCLIFFQYLT